MDRIEALAALQQEVSRFRGRSYAELGVLLNAPSHSEHSGKSGTAYQVEVTAAWDDIPGQVLRLFFSVDNGGIRAYVPVTKCGLVSPGDYFNGEVA